MEANAQQTERVAVVTVQCDGEERTFTLTQSAAPAPAARAAVPRVRADMSAVPAAADAPRVRAAEARPARLRPASGSPRRPPEATT